MLPLSSFSFSHPAHVHMHMWCATFLRHHFLPATSDLQKDLQITTISITNSSYSIPLHKFYLPQTLEVSVAIWTYTLLLCFWSHQQKNPFLHIRVSPRS